jgi:hypothetical protein
MKLIYDVRVMEFSRELTIEIQNRLDTAKEFYPAAEGDVFMETYDVASDEPATIDRSRAAQIAVLVLGSRTMRLLSELLPKRPLETPGCSKCKGTGRLHDRMPDFHGFICDECSGLGWIEV